MSAMMHVDIVSLEEQIFSGKGEAVFVTGVLGEMGIYPGHTQLLSSLKPGQVRILVEGNKEEIFYVKGGVVEVQPGTVTVLADLAIRGHELDEMAAIEAKTRAEKLLAKKATDIDYTRASAELAEALAQIRTIQNLRKKYKL